MKRKQLVRDAKRAALTRMEDAARTEDDFKTVIAQWDKLDENRERKERYHEMQRDEKTLEVGYSGGAVIPTPVPHSYWREIIRGDFISYIYDNAEEIWQVVEDRDIAFVIKNLTVKQKDVLFSSAVRLCPASQIALCTDKTDRAVRKLLTAALDSIREKLAPIILEQIKTEWPQMTLAKRRFLAWYEKEKSALDNGKSG